MTSRPTSRDPIGVRDVVAVAAPSLAILSVLAYGVIRVSYERFYARFGLTPEDVGATSTRILAESGVHVFVYAFLFAVIPYALTLAIFRVADRRVSRRDWRRLLLVVVALAPMAVYQRLTRGGIVGGYMGVAAATLLAIAWWTANADGARRARWWRIGFFWFTSGIFWVTLFYVPGAAGRAGACVADLGERLDFVHTRRHLPDLQPVAVLGPRVDVADVTWLVKPTPPHTPELLYLGQADGFVALFDVRAKRAVRVPAADVVVRTRVDATKCPDTSFDSSKSRAARPGGG